MNVIIVCGAPASGKTTYVKNHMQLGDFIVDLDVIRNAVSFTNDKRATSNLLPTILEIRTHIYRMIAERRIEAKNCWVIACLPKKKERKELATYLNAEVVFLDVPENVCIKRALQDPQRTDKEEQIKIITDYFSTIQIEEFGKLKDGRTTTVTKFYLEIYKNIEE